MTRQGTGRVRRGVEPQQWPRKWVLIAAMGVAAVVAIKAFVRSTTPAKSEDAVVANVPRHLYSPSADAKAEIAQAVAKAGREHKRVILDFGGDWCGDCQVLDYYFHEGANAELLQRNFVLTHVWIGQMDANLDVAAQYGVPVTEGVPALAVLSSTGETLYAQRMGEFKRMRTMDAASVTEFLNKWKS